MSDVFHGYYAPRLHDLMPGQVQVRAPIIGRYVQIGLPKDLIEPLLQPLLVTCGRLPETDDAPALQVVTVARPDGAAFNLNDANRTRRPDGKPLFAGSVMRLTVHSPDGEFWHLSEGVAGAGTQEPFQEALDRVGAEARSAAVDQLPLQR